MDPCEDAVAIAAVDSCGDRAELLRSLNEGRIPLLASSTHPRWARAAVVGQKESTAESRFPAGRLPKQTRESGLRKVLWTCLPCLERIYCLVAWVDQFFRTCQFTKRAPTNAASGVGAGGLRSLNARAD